MESDWDDDYVKPGTLVDDRYEVRRLLGTGAMGAVVEATHILRRAPVALKFMGAHMLQLPGVVERFLNEGIAASRINSEHVVKVLDVSKLPNGQPYLVMEFLDGEDLQALLEREAPRGFEDPARAVHFVLQLLRGLQVAHQAGIIHRDLKPANCFVVRHDGEPDFIKIVDFGISKVQQQGEGELTLTQEGSTMGTPLYVSLEQARDAANVDARSDLYSVAVILYELLCGHTPFQPRTMPELFIQLATVTPKSLDQIRDLPPGLADLVQKGLAKEREDRFQSATEMALALAPYADSRSELVLRQLATRGSARVSRAPSQSPTSQPATLSAPTDTRAPSGGSGTLVSVSSRMEAVAGRSVAVEVGAGPAPAPRRKGLLLGLGLGLMALVGIVLFALRMPSAPTTAPEDVPATPAAALPTTEAKAPAPAATEVPTPSLPAAPSTSASATVAVPSAVRVGARQPPPVESARPGETKPAPATAPAKPSLKQIGIQD